MDEAQRRRVADAVDPRPFAEGCDGEPRLSKVTVDGREYHVSECPRCGGRFAFGPDGTVVG